MAYHVFLQFEPKIKGESETEGYKEQIELSRWNFGVANGVYFDSSKKLQSGTVGVDPITVTKRNDSSTPALMKLVADGKSGKGIKATLSVCISKDGGVKPIITIAMENTIVTSLTMTGYGEGVLEDSVTLAFTKITYQYENLDAKGTSKTKPKFEYDLEKQVAKLPSA